MDPLSEVLGALRATHQTGFRAEVTAPWGFSVPAQRGKAAFYVLSAGHCYLALEGQEPVKLSAAEMVFLPDGSGHQLSSHPGAAVRRLESLCALRAAGTVRFGGGGAEAHLLAGSLRFEGLAAGPILTALGPVVRLPVGGEDGKHRETLVGLLCRETHTGGAGSEAAITRLLDLLLIEFIRAGIRRHCPERCTAEGNFLRLYLDPELCPAVTAIHAHPERPWTVAALAAEAGMSRTAFAVRFTQAAGLAPLAYATWWRMVKACELLRDGEATLPVVAARVGYQSESAFSTAFKRQIGTAPRRYAREVRGRTPETAKN